MLTTHYFGYRKWKDGKPTDIQIEVIVKADVSRQEARRIAQVEIAALEAGQHVIDIPGLNTRVQQIEQTVNRRMLTSYHFMGVN